MMTSNLALRPRDSRSCGFLRCRSSLIVTLLIILNTRHLTSAQSQSAETPHVCIIGGGISGATVAYYLSTLPTPPTLTVLDRSPVPGGRIQPTDFGPDCRPEAGASIIASRNRLLTHFTALLNLTHRTPRRNARTIFWDGAVAVFSTQASPARTALATFKRYGLSARKLKPFVSHLLEQYDRLYPPELADCLSWPAFDSAEGLLARVGLYNLTQTRFEPVVNAQFSRKFVHELVAAVTRVNYGQDVRDMNALAGGVALAGSGDNLWAVGEGNRAIVEGLLRLSCARLRLATVVTRVATYNGTYSLSLSSPSESTDATPGPSTDPPPSSLSCDAVVLAAPYELSDIDMPDDTTAKMSVGRTFRRTDATFVRGALNADTFGAEVVADVTGILTITDAPENFTSIGIACAGNATREPEPELPVYKVFSRGWLDDATVARIFQKGYTVLSRFPWLAYPDFAPPERFAPFRLDAGDGALFYTAPLESAGSAMEMSALSGANVAALVRDALKLAGEKEAKASNVQKDEL